MSRLSGLAKRRVDPSGHRALVLVASVLVLGAVLVAGLVTGATAGSAASTAVGPDEQPNLGCLDAEESEIRDQLDTIAQQTLAALPPALQSRAAGERVEVRIGDTNPTYFGAVVSEGSEVETVQSGRISNPTITGETDCRTVDRITSAEKPPVEFRASLSRNDITWEGATAGRDAAVSYGSKGLQMSHIVASDDTGDTGDATDGFLDGLLLN